MEAGEGPITLTPALPQSNFQLLASATHTVLVAASLFDAHLLAWPELAWFLSPSLAYLPSFPYRKSLALLQIA